VIALLPEYYDEDSRVGIEAKFELGLPVSTVNQGEWLASWVTFPTYSTVWDEENQTDYEVTTNYSLACVIQAELDEAYVMNFEGEGSMWYDDNANVSLVDVNLDD
jgi:hypothetical protein